jgi:uncharacterized protein YeaO (DUF488 family)
MGKYQTSLLMTINIKRIYEPAEKSDGYRILVDRLWPRGIKKEDIHIDVWMKEIAPSTELRKWIHQDPDKWEQFITKYKAELKGSAAWQELLDVIHDHKTVTLLYAAKDEQRNHALVLQQFINTNAL